MEKVTAYGDRGLQWTVDGFLKDLEYANDICLLFHSFEHIQRKLSMLVTEAALVGLAINVKKAKSMRLCTNHVDNFVIQDHPTEDVDNFTYLGSIISKDGVDKD